MLDQHHGGPLEGILVVALEQAVAAPYCSSRLADAGARVIKIERPEGDFARGYDKAANGESSYFVWINRGKESVALNLRQADDMEVLLQLIAQADVFIQNLAPGATGRLGIGSEALRQKYPQLITCDISGYGDSGPLFKMKAYDLLIQAESGLVAVSGAPGEGVDSLGRIGVSVCDINAGLNALIGIQMALLQRQKTGRGSGVSVSLFDSAAELMSVPYLQARYGGKAPERVGLNHPTIAPYGAYTCADGRDILISIQNEREWADFCREVLHQPELPKDPRACSNAARVEHRPWLDKTIAQVFSTTPSGEIIDRLIAAQTAYGNVNSVSDLITHPQLRTRPMPVHGKTLQIPAAPWCVEWDPRAFRPAPKLNEHGSEIRHEFSATRENLGTELQKA
jgi:crotonobetainyl-CoA:carnitine CoA-transferase CaiB-like acyl-CoA transferase